MIRPSRRRPTRTSLLLVAATIAVSNPAASQQADAGSHAIRIVGPAFMALSVPDLEASIRWYSDLFGMSVQTRFGETPVRGAILTAPGLTVELIDDERVSTRPPAGLQDPMPHGVFKVHFYVDSLDPIVQALQSRRIPLVGHWPQSQPPNLMIRDPDGNLLQFSEHRRAVPAHDPSAGSTTGHRT